MVSKTVPQYRKRKHMELDYGWFTLRYMQIVHALKVPNCYYLYTISKNYDFFPYGIQYKDFIIICTAFFFIFSIAFGVYDVYKYILHHVHMRKSIVHSPLIAYKRRIVYK